MLQALSLALLTALALCGTARAQRAIPRPPEELLVSLIGSVGPPPAGRAPAAKLELNVEDTRLPFNAEEARVLSGSQLGANVLEDMEPNRTLYVRGPKELLDKIRRASPEKRLEITGFYRTGSRNLLVNDVKEGDVNRGGERSSVSRR